MLGKLKAKGIQTCIITNGHHKVREALGSGPPGAGGSASHCSCPGGSLQVQRDKLAACNAYRLFENIIVGGGIKPPPLSVAPPTRLLQYSETCLPIPFPR